MRARLGGLSQRDAVGVLVAAPASERGQSRRRSTTLSSAAISSRCAPSREPRQQADHERERPVGVARARNRGVDEPGCPRAWSASVPDGGERDARQQLAHVHRPRGEQREHGERDDDVRDERDRPAPRACSATGPIAPPIAGRWPRSTPTSAAPSTTSTHQPRAARADSAPRCSSRGTSQIASNARPERERDAEARPQRAGEADRQRDAAAGQRLDARRRAARRRSGSARAPSRPRPPAAPGRPRARTRAPRRTRAAAGRSRRTRSRRSARRGSDARSSTNLRTTATANAAGARAAAASRSRAASMRGSPRRLDVAAHARRRRLRRGRRLAFDVEHDRPGQEVVQRRAGAGRRAPAGSRRTAG